MKYRRKVESNVEVHQVTETDTKRSPYIEAHQMTMESMRNGASWPTWLIDSNSVRAFKVCKSGDDDYIFCVGVRRGEVQVDKGAYVIRHPDGILNAMSEYDFNNEYEAVNK